MPANRNALLRYKTIDACLRNRQRRWTLDDLIHEVSEALYEYEGIERGVARRTIQQDLQMMRSDKLGYEAPIIVVNKKFYIYADPDYTITNIPITEDDLEQMATAIAILRQFKGFSAFDDLNGLVHKLEDRVASIKQERGPVIILERNDELRGLQFLDDLYQAVLANQSLCIQYQAFEAETKQDIILHPYCLKEYRNRWYVMGLHHTKGTIVRLGLDRMNTVSLAGISFIPNQTFDPEAHFKDVIGVSVYDDAEIEEVILCLDAKQAPYNLTKPFHTSQKIIEMTERCVTISLRVKINYELEREIMALGEKIQVVKPLQLRERVISRLQEAVIAYHEPKIHSSPTTE